jgi:hypothetical protein
MGELRARSGARLTLLPSTVTEMKYLYSLCWFWTSMRARDAMAQLL